MHLLDYAYNLEKGCPNRDSHAAQETNAYYTIDKAIFCYWNTPTLHTKV